MCRRLANQDRRGRTIGIKVRLDDFSTHTRAITIDEPTNDLDTVKRLAVDLLHKFAAPRPVRLLGVKVAGLDEEHEEAMPAEAESQLALPL